MPVKSAQGFIRLGIKLSYSLCLSLLLISFQVTPGRATSLQGIIQQAILDNPEVQEKWFAFQASSDEQQRSKAGYRPRIDLNTRLGMEWLDAPRGETELQPGEASLQLSQLLYDGFSTRNEVRKFGHVRLARFYELLDTSENIALEASRAYLDVLKFRSLLDLAEINYAQHYTIYQQVRERVEAGVGRGVDLEQATGRLALANSNRVTELTNLHDVSARFLRIVGTLPAAELDDPGEIFNGLLPENIDSALIQAFQTNPAFHASIENVQAAEADRDVRKALYRPNLEFRARHELGNDRSSIDGHSDQSVVEIVFNYNLYRGGADSAALRQFTNQWNLAKKQQVRVCRTVRQTLDIAFNDVQRLEQQLTLLHRHQEAIAKARTAYHNQFDIGQRTLLDLLDTENEYFQARRAYVSASYDQQLAQARTLAAQGRLLARLDIRQQELPDMNAFAPETTRIDPDAICPPIVAPTTELAADPLKPRPVMKPLPVPLIPPAVTAPDLVLKKRLNILFDYRETAIREKYNRQLEETADFLKRYPETIITVNGHTDNIGGIVYNRKLSQARAEAVREQFITEYGVKPSQIFITWFGYSKPAMDNDTAEGRAHNRRTEILAALLNDELSPAEDAADGFKKDQEFIIFPYRGAELINEHTAQVAAIAEFLKQHPDSIVTLDGQTDMVGSNKYNQKLSRARAEVVRNKLIDDYATNPDQIFITWSSYYQSGEYSSTTEGAKTSRRTVVRFSRIIDNLSSLKDKETPTL